MGAGEHCDGRLARLLGYWDSPNYGFITNLMQESQLLAEQEPTFVLVLVLVLESDASKRRLGLSLATVLLGLSLSAETVVSRSGFDDEHE